MALLRRHALYSAITVVLIYMLYTLSSPYEIDNGRDSPYAAKTQPKKARPPKDQAYASFDWAQVPIKNPVESPIPLPTAHPTKLARIQFDSAKDEDAVAKNIRETRRDDVRKQFFKCWHNYRSHAWMHDEIRPISGETTDHFGGWAATLIDALDTLWIMGFEEEFTSAIEDVEMIDFGYTSLDHVNVFETNMRHLGGLLAAFELSKDERLLVKATEVGDMLYHAFDTPNHMPITRWHMREAGEGKPQVADEQVLLAEIGSMTMEFTRLSQLTGDHKYYDAVTRITRLMEQQQDKTKIPGLWPIMVNARKADFTEGSTFTLNSMADSMYEYLPKMYALLGGQDSIYRKMYEKAMEAAATNTLFRPSTPEDLDMLVSGSVRIEGSTVFLDPILQHLSCYTGGMFALGSKLFRNEDHFRIARKLTDSCVWAYKSSPAGIMPEVSHLLKCANYTDCHWNQQAWQDAVAARAEKSTQKDPLQSIANLKLPGGFTAVDDKRYILRPEAIESVFIMYRLTGEQQWQAAAWDMWTAIQRSTDTDIENSALLDVLAEKPPRIDSMESFWMAGTLKYFFLVFSDPDVISLDEFVFNTEAHPFRIPKPPPRHGW
ncbi:class I alpha-mannosidase-like protein [Ampelomyces quisqualis]|uniref:alpha-1,2-Mannosidase n=1 Tax=Ampelomyces quisqualis TaxID=50730 RepID=A0A6A5QY58_AMPQU|nr:class I alpha-mannosidase-like protein [Ampelomyces quisqualis]